MNPQKLNQPKVTNVEEQKLIHRLALKQLPDDVFISTMTICCKITTKFLVENIGKYIDLSINGIHTVKQRVLKEPRTIVPLKKKNVKKRKKKGNFYNQVTLVTKPQKNDPINVKLFTNGSLQMTGCKSIDDVEDVLQKLFSCLRVKKAIINPHNPNSIIEKPFVEDPEQLVLNKIYDFRISMINSNFDIKFEIDREKLYPLLLNDGYYCSYDPNIHACVNIKYTYPNDTNKTISVFVFESGSIIITGANTCDHIIKAYGFINKYLLKHYKDIVKNDTLTNSTILKYLNNE